MAEKIKRFVLLIVAVFFIGFGIAFTKYGALGISPISSVANVVSMKYTSLSFGNWLIVFYFVFVLMQVLILRRNFKCFQFLQLLVSVLSGYFADLGLYVLKFFPNDTYILKLLLVIIGSCVLALGIALSIIADVILSPAEAVIKVIADALKKDFGYTKIAFDISWVALAAVLSLIFFDGKILGIREGTVISAFLVGAIVKCLRTLLQNPLTKLLKGE